MHSNEIPLRGWGRGVFGGNITRMLGPRIPGLGFLVKIIRVTNPSSVKTADILLVSKNKETKKQRNK
jgi:hypothetical protein